MSLTDLMSGMGLSIYAEIALVLFLALFLIIVWRTFLPSRKQEMLRAARMPLDDDSFTTDRTEHENDG